MAYGSYAYGDGPYAGGGSMPPLSFEATSISPLLKFGVASAFIPVIGTANTIAPLIKYGSHIGSIHWTPRDISGRAMPLYPLFKFGTPEYLLPLVPVSIGPLLKLSRHAGILGNKTGLANHVGPLLNFGIPLAVFVTSYPANSVGPLLKFGAHAGIVGLSGQVDSVGQLLKFGTPTGPSKRRSSTVHVLTTKQMVYVSRRKAA